MLPVINGYRERAEFPWPLIQALIVGRDITGASAFARCIPHAQLHIVRHGGHLFLVDSAAEMAGLVAAFLSSDNRPSYPPTDPAT